MFAFGHELAIPFAAADLGLPADGLDRWGELFQAQLQVPTDVGWIPLGPGAFDQGTTGRGIPSLGNATLLTPRPTGIFRGCEPQIIHELSGVLDACQVAQLRHGRHGHSELDPAQGLEGFDHGS